MAKLKTIQIRIDDTLLSRFNSALDREGLAKTHVLIQAIHQFVKESESNTKKD